MRGLAGRRSWLSFSFLCLLLITVCLGCGKSGARSSVPPEVHIYVAASTAHVIEPLAADFQADTGVVVHCNAAASSTLAQQIAQGAPADIYLSANQQWMDYLDDAGMLLPGSRMDLLGNRIVLIAPTRAVAAGTPQAAVTEVLDGFDDWLSMADPDHVPAGIYGKEALQSLGLWDAVVPRVVPAKDVRAALMTVERGEADLGIVYTTDAASSNAAVVRATFPEDSHQPIRYPIAMTKTASPEAKRVFAYLQGDKSRQAFEAAGFTFLGGM